jgi:opacity protein-like surface antigen
MKRTLSHIVIITILVMALMMPGPQLAQAGGDGSTETAIATSIAGALGGALIGYIVWNNRPGNPNPPDWSRQGPGGFYIGGFMGASIVPSQRWRYDNRSGGQFAVPYSVTTDRIQYQNSVVGGLKGGYFFHKFPYLGLEGEFSYSRNDIREQIVNISPALVPPGNTPNPVIGSTVRIPAQSVSVMTLALHIIGRVGFFKSEEIPFGRLQPYVGIGPGFVVIYGEIDAAKNFSLEALAGMRYMIRKNLSLFVEYNISQQWKVELEQQKLKQLPAVGGFEQRGLATFDFQKHHWVAGICFHFL